STNGASVFTSRAVAATLSPRASAASAHTRPKPRDVPVMNQTFCVTSKVPLDCSLGALGQCRKHGLQTGVAGDDSQLEQPVPVDLHQIIALRPLFDKLRRIGFLRRNEPRPQSIRRSRIA